MSSNFSWIFSRIRYISDTFFIIPISNFLDYTTAFKRYLFFDGELQETTFSLVPHKLCWREIWQRCRRSTYRIRRYHVSLVYRRGKYIFLQLIQCNHSNLVIAWFINTFNNKHSKSKISTFPRSVISAVT